MKISLPQLPAALDEISAAAVCSEASLEACRLTGAQLTGTIAQSVSLDEAELEKVLLAEAKLDKLTARDLIVKNSDFSAAQCPDASFLRAFFDGGRMTGWDCNKSTLQDVTFKSCKLNMTNFRFSKLTRVRFIDCVLSGADFLGAALRGVSFEGCQLEQAEFAQCDMKDVDLRTSELAGLKGWQYLKGATIDSIQLTAAAPYLANELGINITD